MDTNDILVMAGGISKHIHDSTESSVDAELVAYMIHRGICAENDMRVAEEYEKIRRHTGIVNPILNRGGKNGKRVQVLSWNWCTTQYKDWTKSPMPMLQWYREIVWSLWTKNCLLN